MKWFYYKLNYYKLFYVKDLLHLQHRTGPGSTFYSKFIFDPFNILSQASSACPPLGRVNSDLDERVALVTTTECQIIDPEARAR